jgi:hypothetical protein
MSVSDEGYYRIRYLRIYYDDIIVLGTSKVFMMTLGTSKVFMMTLGTSKVFMMTLGTSKVFKD